MSSASDRAERARLIMRLIQQSKTLREVPDEAKWIALKFSCSEKKARKLIAEARRLVL
jgi:hypothetical protein